MRTFIALDLPEQFSHEVHALARRLSSIVEGRFMRAESYHLTLAFLGDIDSTDLQAALYAIDAACADRLPVPLTCDGLGKFGKSGDATLWLSVVRNDAIEGLASSIRQELENREVDFDRKPFKPHITLARRARIPRSELPPLAFPETSYASSVTLFKSELSRTGATYKPLHTHDLGK